MLIFAVTDNPVGPVTVAKLSQGSAPTVIPLTKMWRCDSWRKGVPFGSNCKYTIGFYFNFCIPVYNQPCNVTTVLTCTCFNDRLFGRL